MKIVSFGEPGRERPGVVVGEAIIDLAKLRPEWPSTWGNLLRSGLWPEVKSALDEVDASSSSVPFGSVRLGPPIPDPTKIIAIGLNYRDHAEEQNKKPPERPLLFSKAPSSLIGPNDPICLPDPDEEDRVDAEAELGVVVGKRAKGIQPEDAESHILGYTVVNDVSGRAAQYGDRQWFRGKSFDTFAPCGPWVVLREDLPEPGNVALSAHWNETKMQDGRTDNLIHDIPRLLSYVSRQMTLEPGDLIATGTPAGVGVFRDPPVFLRKGDTVRVRVEGIGELINPVV